MRRQRVGNQTGSQFLRITLAALLVALLPGVANAGNCPNTNPNDYSDDTGALQWCLDNLGQVYLDPGSPGYMITDTLRFRRHNLLLTSSQGGTYVKIWAANGMGSVPMLRVQDVCDASCGDPNGWEISWISFDGNRFNRGTGNCSNLQNVRARGSNWLFRHNESQFAPCGSGLQVAGDNFQVYDNLFAWNGWEVTPVADGLTIDRCEYGWISGNWFYDNTDIDLAGDAGPGCTYELNRVYHYNRFGIAGINIAGGPGGTVTKFNTIESGYDLLTFGLLLGNHLWVTSEWSDVGEVRNNTIRGAVVNLAIDGINTGSVFQNYPDAAQGSRHHPQGSPCTYSGNYTAGDFGSAYIEGAPTPYVFHSTPEGCHPQ